MHLIVASLSDSLCSASARQGVYIIIIPVVECATPIATVGPVIRVNRKTRKRLNQAFFFKFCLFKPYILATDQKVLQKLKMKLLQITVVLIPLLQQSDLENLGVVHVGERVMLVSLAKAIESKLLLCSCS